MRDRLVAPHDACVHVVLLDLAATEASVDPRPIKEASMGYGGGTERHGERVCDLEGRRDIYWRVVAVGESIEGIITANDAGEVIWRAEAIEAATRGDRQILGGECLKSGDAKCRALSAAARYDSLRGLNEITTEKTHIAVVERRDDDPVADDESDANIGGRPPWGDKRCADIVDLRPVECQQAQAKT